MATRLLLIFCTLVSSNAFQAVNAASASKLDEALAILAKTESGRALLNEASRAKVPIFPGTVSRTDIVATRTTRGREETLGFKMQVFVAQDKDPVFQALDISHELIHATHPQENPFDPHLSPEAYIRHGIESEGGEAKAIARECQVGQEIVSNPVFTEKSDSGDVIAKPETVQLIRARCRFVWQTARDESKWKRSFYQLGHYYRDFLKQVAGLRLEMDESEKLSRPMEPRSAMFHSAVAHKPYPLALLEEYVQITKKICERSQGAGLARLGRTLSAIGLTRRCQAVGVELSDE